MNISLDDFRSGILLELGDRLRSTASGETCDCLGCPVVYIKLCDCPVEPDDRFTCPECKQMYKVEWLK